MLSRQGGYVDFADVYEIVAAAGGNLAKKMERFRDSFGRGA
jgi:hypothetical protein